MTVDAKPALSHSDETADREFVKGLGLTSSTMLVMGSMIGSGIFLVSAEIARDVDSPALLIAAWLDRRSRPTLTERLRPFQPTIADDAELWLSRQP